MVVRTLETRLDVVIVGANDESARDLHRSTSRSSDVDFVLPEQCAIL